MPPRGQFELAGPRFVGVGEGPFLVAEQLAFEQRLGDRRAVDGDERLIAAAAEVVDRLADDFLAGAVFAEDQHRQVGVGDAANRRAQRLDRRAVADQLHAFGRLVDDLPVRVEQVARTAACSPARWRRGGQLDQSRLRRRR